MQPLVSCIMPARGRREMTRQAIDCFLSQDYPNRELIILQDVDDPSVNPDEWPDLRVMFAGGEGRQSIAWKRNTCCEFALGDIICHWDSDDLYTPDRISTQVRDLEESGKAVTGFRNMYFVDGPAVFLYVGGPRYVLGTSLMYRKDWWKDHRFTEPRRAADHDYITKVATGEDNRFVKEAAKADQLNVSSAYKHIVARIHPGSSSTKHPLERSEYRRAQKKDLPNGFHSLLFGNPEVAIGART